MTVDLFLQHTCITIHFLYEIFQNLAIVFWLQTDQGSQRMADDRVQSTFSFKSLVSHFYNGRMVEAVL